MKRLLLFILVLLWAGSSIGQAIIGTGTTTSNGSSADPIERYYNYEHFQIVYLASELTAAGMPSGATITALGFSVSESAVSLANFTISMGHTTQTLANPYISSGLTTVKNAFTYAPVVQTAGNFDMITFDVGFNWDGTSNIVVNTCTGSNPYLTPYGGLRYTSATSGAMRGIRTDGTNNCASSTSSNYSYRPNIRFNYTSGACSGMPAPGNTLSSANPVCSGVDFTLSLQNATQGSGVTYQWQKSATGSDPWTNFGSSNGTAITNQVSATYYRCQVTCSGNTGTSTPVYVTMNSLFNCYCASAAESTGDEDITNVTFGLSLNNTTPCASLVGSQGTGTGTANLYSNFTTAIAATDVPQGVAAPISVTITECAGDPYGHVVAVYIDFNQNGLLTDAGEDFVIWPYASSNTHTINANIQIPLSASFGNTLMRIVCKESSTFGPCLVSSWGETEDYVINIIEPPACVPPTNLFTSDIEFDQAVLNWTGSGDVLAYDVKYGPDGFDVESQGTLLSGLEGSPYPLAGLEENTDYDWYVRSFCETDPSQSGWAGPVSFTTLCMPISTLPYTQGFEGTWPPECWLDPVTANYGWNRDIYGVAHTGLHWAYCNLAGSELFSPEFTLTDDSKLSFWFRAESSTYPQDMDVKVGDDVVYQIIGATNSTYELVELSLEDYTGQTVRISFLGLYGTGGFAYGILVDDFAVEKICKLEGFVYDYNNNPVAGATIELVDGISTISGLDGHYLLSPLSPGEQEFKCFKTGYTPEFSTIEIPEGTIVPHNFTLTEPTMAVEPSSLWALLNTGETQTNVLEINNDGNGILGWNADIFYDISTYPGGPLMAPQRNNQYAPNGPFTLDAGREQSSGNRAEMVCPDGSFFSLPPAEYTTGYNSTLVNGYKVYQSFAGVSNGIINSIRFWGVFSSTPPETVTFKIDFCLPGIIPGSVVSTVTLPLEAVNTGNYMGSYTVFEFTAEVPIVSLPAGWVSVEMQDESPYFFWLNTFAGDYPAYQENAPDPNLPASVSVCLGGTEGWISLSSYTGSIPGFGGSQNVTALLDPAKTPATRAPGVTYNANIVFTSPSGIASVTVPVTMIITDGGLKGPEDLTPFIVNEDEGKFMLKWNYFTLRDMVFNHFEIYSNGVLVGTTPVSNFPLEFTEDGAYCYKVFAVYEGGVYSEPSNEVCITYPLAPGVPVANWALLLGGILMASFVFIRFLRRS